MESWAVEGTLSWLVSASSKAGLYRNQASLTHLIPKMFWKLQLFLSALSSANPAWKAALGCIGTLTARGHRTLTEVS